MSGWVEANQAALSAALAVLRARLAQRDGAGERALAEAEAQEAAALAAMPGPSALDSLCAAFALTPFERQILLLCAGVELDGGLQAALAGRGGLGAPSFGLALETLPGAHWDALAPDGPLRRWRLIELGPGGLSTAPLQIDERVLQHLTGVGGLDRRLEHLLHPLPMSAAPPPSHRALAEEVARFWTSAASPLVQLYGADSASRGAVAAAAAASLGLRLAALSAADLPESPAERHALARLCEREAALSGVVLLVELSDSDPPGTAQRAVSFLSAIGRLAAASARDPLPAARRPAARVEVSRPDAAEQRSLWHEALGERAADYAGPLEAVIAHFSLGAEGIRSAALSLPPTATPAALWQAARRAARPELEGLGQRIDARARWDQLVLPEVARGLLEDMVRHARNRHRVHEEWGFAALSSRGLGLTALFSGPSGTGKTMAAEVLAHTLGVDLYRVDLSAVMSKYIGETEKHLRQIFDALEGSGAILLFDEADALFSRRGEVRDSHDRYANVEVSYLLQRMESYAGLCVLTTNLKSNIDPAFLRRIRFLIPFPFPGREQRLEIWRHTLPDAMPQVAVDLDRLSQLKVSGGTIRNIALNAAVLAADEAGPLRMSHLLRAARAEYQKLEQPLSPAEFGGWS